jgi:predicted ATPase
MAPAEGEDRSGHPWDLPVAAALAAGFALDPKVTYLVGENGTGKSTLLEALAVAAGLNPEGGSRNFAFSTRESHSPLVRASAWSAVRAGRGRTSSCAPKASSPPRPTWRTCPAIR